MGPIKTKILLISLLTFSISATEILIKSVQIQGNNKTKESVIKNIISINDKTTLHSDEIEARVQELRNTNLFSDVDYKIKDNNLFIEVEEKWTTIPIFKFNSGGGVSQTILGVYDPNLFGRYIELGTQYERLEETNSYVFWFKNPRLFGSSHGIELQAWSINRLRTKYQQEIDDKRVINGFLHKRDKLYLAYYKKLSAQRNISFFYEYNEDHFSEELVPIEVRDANIEVGLPPKSTFHFLGISLKEESLKGQSHLQHGYSYQLQTRIGLTREDNIRDFFDIEMNLKYYKRVFKESILAQRILAATTSTESLQYWNYLGGVDRIRGFVDNRFAGRHFILSNTELRTPVLQTKNTITQAVTFLDFASIDDDIENIGEIDGASTGLGLRLILPKVYRFVLRLDYATYLEAKDDNEISFGVQQFF